MDLIYADSATKKEIGVLTEYSLDLAFGQDENSFSLTMPLKKRDIKYGSYVYLNDTEYGGIVDKIKIDTANRQIIYSGRTWHGILASKIIEPDNGTDYLIVNGDANEIIGQLITRAGLDDIFSVDSEAGYVGVDNYPIRYGNLYNVLVEMLYNFGLKLKIEHVYVKHTEDAPYIYYDWNIQLSAVSYINYAADESWNSNQRDFVAEQNNNPINHIVCLGGGSLRNRHVIHLFSDGVNIMPYIKNNLVMYMDVRRNIATNIRVSQVINSISELPVEGTDNTYIGIMTGEVYQWYNNQWNLAVNHFLLYPSLEVIDAPIKDDEYILDKTAIQFIGIEENAIVYDYPNAQTHENYALVDSKPSDWDSIDWNRNNKYYKYSSESDNNYAIIEGEESVIYELLTAKPSDWDTDVGKYYIGIYDMGGRLLYYKVEDVNVENYTILQSAPGNWQAQYMLYYIKDGEVYKEVEGVSESGYEVADIATAKNEWNANYGQYYTRSWNGAYWVYTSVPAAIRSLYIKQTRQPDDWATNYANYFEIVRVGNTSSYKKVEGVVKKVKKKQTIVAPTWKTQKYYTKYEYNVAPTFNYVAGELWKQYSRTVAPRFMTNTYYEKRIVTQAPEFEYDTYYKERTTYVAPAYSQGSVYVKYEDHYADLVANAIKRFKEYLNCDKINISLKPSEQYDIGDIVGATDDVTGLTVVKPITKKIVKISKERTSISYETGGMGL